LVITRAPEPQMDTRLVGVLDVFKQGKHSAHFHQLSLQEVPCGSEKRRCKG